MTAFGSASDLIKVGWDYEIEPFGHAVTRSRDREGEALVSTFGGVQHWRELPVTLLDAAPDGMASALSFFSDAAIQYFIGAYLLADLEGSLRQSDPLFHLVHGFDATAFGSRDGWTPARSNDGRVSSQIKLVQSSHILKQS